MIDHYHDHAAKIAAEAERAERAVRRATDCARAARAHYEATEHAAVIGARGDSLRQMWNDAAFARGAVRGAESARRAAESSWTAAEAAMHADAAENWADHAALACAAVQGDGTVGYAVVLED